VRAKSIRGGGHEPADHEFIDRDGILIEQSPEKRFGPGPGALFTHLLHERLTDLLERRDAWLADDEKDG
jgi:hypothetical protein